MVLKSGLIHQECPRVGKVPFALIQDLETLRVQITLVDKLLFAQPLHPS